MSPAAVIAWLGQVTPRAPGDWDEALWTDQGLAVWTWLAPLLIEGQQRGRWHLDGLVGLACLREDPWPHLAALKGSPSTLASLAPPWNSYTPVQRHPGSLRWPWLGTAPDANEFSHHPLIRP